MMDVICISETWFRFDVNDNYYYLEGYRIFRSDRVSNTGGVAIYVQQRCSKSAKFPITCDRRRISADFPLSHLHYKLTFEVSYNGRVFIDLLVVLC